LRKRTETAVAVTDARYRLEPARRNVDDDARLVSRDRQHARLERPGDERDRAVAARGRVARVVEEHDTEVGAGVLGSVTKQPYMSAWPRGSLTSRRRR
jgi:hypothetical protein